MTSRFILPFADVGNGISPSDGAKLFFFVSGSTTTLLDTFSDSAGTIPNTNPVIADSDGVFPSIFISGAYKVILKDKNDVQQWEEDPITDFALQSSIDNNLVTTYAVLRDKTSTDYTDGDIIDVTNDGIAGSFVVKTGAVTDNGGTLIVFTDDSNRHAERVFNGDVFVEWFSALVDGSTDDSTAWQAAIDYVLSLGGGTVSMGEGITGLATQLLANDDNLTIIGAGQQASTFKALSGLTTSMILVQKPGAYIDKGLVIHDIGFDGDNIAANGLNVDSSANGEYYRLQMDNFTDYCVVSAPNQTSARFNEFNYFHDIKWKESLGWGKFSAADSRSTDIDIQRIRGGGPAFAGWGLIIQDCDRFTVDEVGAFNNSGVAGFLGAVSITAPGTGSGASPDVQGHIIDGVQVEDSFGTAEGVVIDADGTTRIRGCRVGGIRTTPTSLVAMRFANTSGTPSLNRGNTFTYAPLPYGTGQIQVDADVKRAIINYGVDATTLDDALVNNGDFTLVNGSGEESNNAAGPDVTQWDAGNFINFTDTSTPADATGLYLMKQDGTAERISIKQARGKETQDGDGATTEFTIAHGLGTAPTFADVSAQATGSNKEAIGDFGIAVNSTNIFIRYLVAPVTGTNNLIWFWKAEV